MCVSCDYGFFGGRATFCTHHKVKTGWGELGHHRLRVRIVGRLEHSVKGLVHPEFPLVVISLACKANINYCRVLAKNWKKHDPPELGCPDTDHSPKSEQNRNNVCHHELNSLCISGQSPFETNKKAGSLAIFFESIFQ